MPHQISSDIYSFYQLIFQKAEAQLAYELQAAKINQKIRNEEIQIQVNTMLKISKLLLKSFFIQTSF